MFPWTGRSSDLRPVSQVFGSRSVSVYGSTHEVSRGSLSPLLYGPSYVGDYFLFFVQVPETTILNSPVLLLTVETQ